MENTLENKRRFSAIYFGQKVYKTSQNVNHPAFDLGPVLLLNPDSYLDLKTISSITDEELVKIAKFYESTAHNVKLEDDQILFDFIYGDQGASGAIEISDGYCQDWLRSNGFATKWMEFSIEDLVSFGWIKLKEN